MKATIEKEKSSLVTVTIKVEAEQRAKLEKLAKDNSRTITGEIRLAIANHVKKAK